MRTFFEMLNGGTPEFAPYSGKLYDSCVLATNNADQPWGGGVDPFGVNWAVTPEGAIPEPGRFLFEEIEDWEKHVRFPEVSSLGLGQMASLEVPKLNREEKITTVLSVCGLFERMAAFMGFENTLFALLDDPDSCRDFLEAFSDYKIRVLIRIIDLCRPDMIILFDDIATANNLFMSKETWRDLFKPYLRKIGNAVRERDVVFGEHTCGLCQDILDDYVDIGIQLWNSAQPVNDLGAILDKYGNKLLVNGGRDSQDPASWIGASEETVIEEINRCLQEYSRFKTSSLQPF